MDWYHADEHLANAAKLFKGDGTPAFQLWLNSHETALYQGHASASPVNWSRRLMTCPMGWLIYGAKRATSHEHQQRMNYLEMRGEEYVIGSAWSKAV